MTTNPPQEMPQAISSSQTRSGRKRRLPFWLRANLPQGTASGKFQRLRRTVTEGRLHTVCEEARCPNIHECWGRGTATFMVAGKACTRTCRFCAVQTLRSPPPPDPDEPQQLASAVASMALSHAVITVVNRDDLSLSGADHYRQCLCAVHQRVPKVTLELLSSDLGGETAALAHLLDATPIAVFAHNVECAPRLDPVVRDRRASFDQSLAVLAAAKRLCPELWTKTSLMLGLGEDDVEVADVIAQVRDAGVDILTLGQYLAPTLRHHPVQRFVTPEEFADWDRKAREIGFKAVASGPLVRSSYRAGLLLDEVRGVDRHKGCARDSAAAERPMINTAAPVAASSGTDTS
jgi:lipoic acid synthetase